MEHQRTVLGLEFAKEHERVFGRVDTFERRGRVHQKKPIGLVS
jgi:hypothetical protein